MDQRPVQIGMTTAHSVARTADTPEEVGVDEEDVVVVAADVRGGVLGVLGRV